VPLQDQVPLGVPLRDDEDHVVARQRCLHACPQPRCGRSPFLCSSC